jgi:hypothetical protein
MKSLQTLRLSIIALVSLAWVSLYAAPRIMPEEEAEETKAPDATATNKPGISKKIGAEQINTFVESFSNDGPNTVDQAEDKIGTNGNWVKKKDYLMRSFDVQQEIEALATQIETYRSIYQQKFNGIDDQLDAFYKQLGLEQGKVQDIFTQLTEYIEKKKHRRIARFKENILEVREQQLAIEQLEESLKMNQEELAQVKADLKSIEELDKSVNTRMQKADDQIGIAQREAARTKEIVEAMWDMLDDRRAKAAYFELKDGILRRLQNINTYLQQELLSDLEKVGGTISTQIKKAREGVKQLEDKGFIIQDRGKRLDELNIKKAKEAAEELIKLQHKEHTPKKTIQNIGFFDRLYNKVVDFIAGIYRFFKNLFAAQPLIKARTRGVTREENISQAEQQAPGAGQASTQQVALPPVVITAPPIQTPEQTAARQSFAKPIAPIIGQQQSTNIQSQQTAATVGMPSISLEE